MVCPFRGITKDFKLIVFLTLTHYYLQLHHMHKRIETMERDETNRPSFKCPKCENTYSDLEVNQLIDPVFGIYNVLYLFF